MFDWFHIVSVPEHVSPIGTPIGYRSRDPYIFPDLNLRCGPRTLYQNKNKRPEPS